jgi:hypothetical protein
MSNFSSSGENSGFSVMGRDELEAANGGQLIGSRSLPPQPLLLPLSWRTR